MENIYFNCVLTKKIVVHSKYLNENINNYIDNYLKEKTEGKCIDEGYVKIDSIKFLKKSVGILLGSKFTGDITYDVAYSATICNPVNGNIIETSVKSINKFGILCTNGPLKIIIARQLHQNDNDFNDIKENDVIKVEVIGKRFSLNDKEIQIVAKIWKDGTKQELKKPKKEILSSDLTPITADNEFIDNEFIDIEEDNQYNSEDDGLSIEDEENDEDEDIEEDEENDEDENIKLENPDINNLEADDIEFDDDYDDNDLEEDDEIEDDEF